MMHSSGVQQGSAAAYHLPRQSVCLIEQQQWQQAPLDRQLAPTFWSVLPETSCRKSGMPLRSGMSKPRLWKKGITSPQGPWNRMRPAGSSQA